MPTFCGSKVEQVLSAVCILSESLDPCLQVVTSPLDPSGANEGAIFVGLSALRTVLEDALASNDPKISSPTQKKLLAVAETIAESAVALCMQCASLPSSISSSSSAPSSPLLLAALNLIKTLIARLPVGPFITSSLIALLFSVAGASSAPAAMSAGLRWDPLAAQVAVEALTELMSKRYLPRSASGEDSGAEVLVELVARAIGLISSHRAVLASSDTDGAYHESQTTIAALLEFLGVFSQTHLERCLSLPSRSLAGSITSLLSELCAITCATSDPALLVKAVAVWENVFAVEAITELFVTTPAASDAVSLPLAMHLVNSCLLHKNELLGDLFEDLEGELSTEPFSAPIVREILDHITGGAEGGGGGTGGAARRDFDSEERSDGTALREGACRLLSDLVSQKAAGSVAAWMAQTLPPVTTQCLSQLADASSLSSSSTSAVAAADLCFVVRLLPICLDKAPLATQLAQVVHQLVESRCHAKGRAHTALVTSCCSIVGQLVQHMHGSASPRSPGVSDDSAALAAVVTSVMEAVTRACDTMVSPCPLAITGSVTSLLLQSVRSAGDETLMAAVATQLHTILFPSLASQPLEVQALLLCISDRVSPSHVAAQCVQQLVDYAAQPAGVWGDAAAVSQCSRLCASLDAVARMHALSNAAERARVSQTLAPTCSVVPVLFQSCLGALSVAVIQGAAQKAPLVTASRLLLSLSCGSLQSLGRKVFGPAAASMLEIAVSFVESGDAGGSYWARLVVDGCGMGLLKQMLTLVSACAVSSGSAAATVSSQCALSHRLLVAVSSALGDERVCVELLQDTLRAGNTVIHSYWQLSGHGQGAAIVEPSVELLVQLIVGSLGPSVPPQDALVALDGVTTLASQHNLFAEAFFVDKGCWASLARACLVALVVRAHAMHSDALTQLLDALVRGADFSRSGTYAGSSAWSVLGGEAVKVAEELGCVELAHSQLGSLSQQFPDISKLDVATFVAHVVTPLSAQVAIMEARPKG